MQDSKSSTPETDSANDTDIGAGETPTAHTAANTPDYPRRMTKREAGRLGGLATVSRHGRAHMQAIGRRGFQTTANRYWGGDRRRMCERLAELGRMAYDPAPWNGAWYYPKKAGEPW